MSILAGRLAAAVFVTGTPTTLTDEPTTASGNISYQITDTAKRVLDPTYAIVVEDGGSPTAESYTLNRLNGTVTFGLATSRTITITGKYLPTVKTITTGKECTYTISADNVDITTLGENYINRKQALLSFTASLSDLYVDDTYIGYLTAGNPLVLEIYSDSSTAYDIRAWVIPSSDEASGSVDGIVEESIELEGTTDADLRCLTLV